MLGVQRLGFRQFLLELSEGEMCRRELAPVGRIVREALAARVTAEAVRGNKLSYLRPAAELQLSRDETEPSGALESLQRYLFSSDAVPLREADGTVEIFSTSGEALECVEIARRIGAAAEEGVPIDQIAVLLRSPDRHQSLVAESLRRASIPAYCARGAARPDVAGRVFLALLNCAGERIALWQRTLLRNSSDRIGHCGVSRQAHARRSAEIPPAVVPPQ